MSARSSSAGSASKAIVEPPKRRASSIARSRRRLATNIVETPCSASARAVSSAVSPAPMISTWRLASSPSALRAASTATDATLAPPAPIAVSVRTRLPVASAARNSLFVERPGRARGERRLVGALDLALHLGLADDHRLQPARDAVEVARGVAVAVRVDAVDQLGRAQPRLAGEHAQHGRLGLDRVADDDVELGAVAGREHDRLADLRVLGQLAQEPLRAPVGQRDALAHAPAARSCATCRAAAARSHALLLRRAARPRARSTSSDSSPISRSIRPSFVAMIET